MNQTIEDGLVINKSTIMVQHLKPENKYDLVYFDAFGPRVEEKLWDISVLKLIFNLMNNDGVFVTYCAKGQVRRDLEQIGFKVERLPGPPGKREMLRATKMNNGTQKLEVSLKE
jgi:tRNA U34 5-methylaminomethyl-2-thiouridine-forming methyltransferase MnmC